MPLWAAYATSLELPLPLFFPSTSAQHTVNPYSNSRVIPSFAGPAQPSSSIVEPLVHSPPPPSAGCPQLFSPVINPVPSPSPSPTSIDPQLLDNSAKAATPGPEQGIWILKSQVTVNITGM